MTNHRGSRLALPFYKAVRLLVVAGAFAGFFASPARTQDGVVDPAALADVLAAACLFDTLDFDTEYAALTKAAAKSGLPLVVAQEQTVVYGDMSATNLVIGRKIDELFCALRMPAADATKEVFAVFESRFEAAITAAFPDRISQPNDDPSPHIDGHDWVASFPGKMHYAATINWGTEDGLMVAIGFRQLYE